MLDASRYGPWAVVAGGSEGVGAAMAHQLARAGLNLVLVARSSGPLEKTATAVRTHGVNVETIALDLVQPDAVARIRAVIDLNVSCQLELELEQHFGGQMKQRRRGGILLVGSLAGYLGQPELVVYSAAKAFARIFAEGLWLELKPYDVHVLHLVLGVTRTRAMERAGLRFDLPGPDVAEPDDVAAEGLAGWRAGQCGSPAGTSTSCGNGAA